MNRYPYITSVVVILTGIYFYPISLERIYNGWSDFPIFYQAGQGDLSLFTYNDFWAFVFKDYFNIGMGGVFTVFYVLSIATWVVISRKIPIWLQIPLAYSFIISIRLGQTTPILGLLCLSPFGAVLASMVKPYLVLFVVLHAYLYKVKISKRFGAI